MIDAPDDTQDPSKVSQSVADEEMALFRKAAAQKPGG